MKIEISTDKSRLDLTKITEWLANSYWAKNIPQHVVEKSVQNSFCFGAYSQNTQVGFARVITDYATYAYVADVMVDEAYRGHGIGKQIMTTIMQDANLQNLRRWSLVTIDAHTLYEQFGFHVVSSPERHMEILRPEIYSELL
jgi:N-acetylglutamate synthase-like GNAT family acetyltransferase